MHVPGERYGVVFLSEYGEHRSAFGHAEGLDEATAEHLHCLAQRRLGDR